MNIILASQSPRRRELLARLPLDFTVSACDINEAILPNEKPCDYLSRMVTEKAMAFIEQLKKSGIETKSGIEPVLSQSLILTADTIGVMPNSNDILVKPTDKADAIRMWEAMSGQTHFVWTAVKASVVNCVNNEVQVVWEKHIIEKTEVTFVTLSEDDMEWYWQTEEPVDKAGAYAIQGLASAWVDRINGSYTNVVGLPLAQTKELISLALQQG